MKDADREGSRGNTNLFVSSFFAFCVRLLHQNNECIIVRESLARPVNRERQLAPLDGDISTP